MNIAIKCSYCGTKSFVEVKEGMSCPKCGDKNLEQTKLKPKGNVFGYPKEEKKEAPKNEDKRKDDPTDNKPNEPGEKPPSDVFENWPLYY